MSTQRILALMAMLVVATAGPLMAAPITWTGAEDTSFTHGGNWTGGSGAPGNGDVAVFVGDAAATRQPYLPSSYIVQGYQFDTAGWTLSGADGATAKVGTSSIVSSGAGANVIDVILADQYAGQTLTANAGNTLVLNKGILRARDWATAGEGTVVMYGGDNLSSRAFNLGAAVNILNDGLYGSYSSSLADDAALMGNGGLSMYNYQVFSFGVNSRFSPGGDGTYGDEIGTFRFDSQSDTVRGVVTFDDTTTVNIDLGDTVGACDLIELSLSASEKGKLYLMGAELNLRGSGAIPDGDYVILEDLENPGQGYAGTFGTITYNGAPIDPSKVAVTYNTDTIVLSLTGVPEPATAALVALGGLALVRRRR